MSTSCASEHRTVAWALLPSWSRRGASARIGGRRPSYVDLAGIQLQDDGRDEHAGSWYVDKRVDSFGSVSVPRSRRSVRVPQPPRIPQLAPLDTPEADYLSQWDLEQVESPAALEDAYDLIVFAGHHEYVTTREYDLVEAYRDLGGNLMFLSANNFFWRVEREGDLLVKSSRWRDLGRPEAALVGVQYVSHQRSPRLMGGTEDTCALVDVRENDLHVGSGFARGGVEIDQVTGASPPGVESWPRSPPLRPRHESPDDVLPGRGARVFAAGAFHYPGCDVRSGRVARARKPVGAAGEEVSARLAVAAARRGRPAGDRRCSTQCGASCPRAQASTRQHSTAPADRSAWPHQSSASVPVGRARNATPAARAARVLDRLVAAAERGGWRDVRTATRRVATRAPDFARARGPKRVLLSCERREEPRGKSIFDFTRDQGADLRQRPRAASRSGRRDVEHARRRGRAYASRPDPPLALACRMQAGEEARTEASTEWKVPGRLAAHPGRERNAARLVHARPSQRVCTARPRPELCAAGLWPRSSCGRS